MNKKRRKQIEALAESLRVLFDRLEDIRSDEQEYLNGIPENLAGSQKAIHSENVVELLEISAAELESSICNLDDVIAK